MPTQVYIFIVESLLCRLSSRGTWRRLAREFWTILFKEIKSSYFEGGVDGCSPRYDALGLQV